MGGTAVSAHYLERGHTNGDAVILLLSERVLRTGDLFVNGSAPFIDYGGPGSIVDWTRPSIAYCTRPWPRGKEGGSGEVAGCDCGTAVARQSGLRGWHGGRGQAPEWMDDSLGFMARSLPGMCAELAN